MKNNYALITPVKDEEEMLLEFAEQVKNQTERPSFWLIINDASKDDTLKIGRTLSEKYSWIRIESIDSGPSYGFEEYIKTVRYGFRKINTLLKGYNYLAKADVDIGLASDYFGRIMSILEGNPTVGVASGILVDGENIRRDYPYEGAIVYKRECLNEVGYIGHKTTLIKARQNGWEWYVEPSLVEYHKRPSDSRKDSMDRGRHVYRAGQSFFTSLFYTSYYFIKRNPKEGKDFLVGYLKNKLANVDIIDEEVRAYYRKMPRRIIRNGLKKLSEFLTGKEGFETFSKGIHDEITKKID